MSAVLKSPLHFRHMQETDVDVVMAIEVGAYEFPWTAGNFRDSIHSGYECRMLVDANWNVVGYYVLTIAAGEAHLLNVSVDRTRQGQGYGRQALIHVIGNARHHKARVLFLEVRPSNASARGLYASLGFRQVAVRKGYYPASLGREEALVLALDI